MNNAALSGFLGGFARTNPFGRGSQFAQGIAATPLERLAMAADKEGSLADVKKDLEDFARFSPATAEYMVGVNYGGRPAGAELMLKLLEGTNPPDFANWSPKEREDFLKKQIPMILRTLEAPGTPAPTGAVRAEMKPPLEEKYGREKFLGERWEPKGLPTWGEETKKRFFGGVRGPGLEKPPMTAGEAAEARLSGKNLGEVPITYAEFQKSRTKLFRELTADDQPVAALLVEGGGAATTQLGWWVGDKAATEKMEKKHPFLKDTRTAALLKTEATGEGLVNWSKFDSKAIESASPDEKMDAWTFLLQFSNLEKATLWYIFFNWFGGEGVPAQPRYWPAMGGAEGVSAPPIGGVK